MNEPRDSFLMYRSFYECIKDLPIDKKYKMFEVICEYALNAKSIEMDSVEFALFTLIKPQLDANYKKYKNGGKKKSKSNSDENDEQTDSKQESNEQQKKTKIKQDNSKTEQTCSKPEQNGTNDNENVNGNGNKNENENHTENDINERKELFGKEIEKFVHLYNREMCLEFYYHWSEYVQNGTMMKWEEQKYWQLENRLKKWYYSPLNKHK